MEGPQEEDEGGLHAHVVSLVRPKSALAIHSPPQGGLRDVFFPAASGSFATPPRPSTAKPAGATFEVRRGSPYGAKRRAINWSDSAVVDEYRSPTARPPPPPPPARAWDDQSPPPPPPSDPPPVPPEAPAQSAPPPAPPDPPGPAEAPPRVAFALAEERGGETVAEGGDAQGGGGAGVRATRDQEVAEELPGMVSEGGDGGESPRAEEGRAGTGGGGGEAMGGRTESGGSSRRLGVGYRRPPEMSLPDKIPPSPNLAGDGGRRKVTGDVEEQGLVDESSKSNRDFLVEALTGDSSDRRDYAGAPGGGRGAVDPGEAAVRRHGGQERQVHMERLVGEAEQRVGMPIEALTALSRADEPHLWKHEPNVLLPVPSSGAGHDAEVAITAFQSMTNVHMEDEDETPKEEVKISLSVWKADDLPRTRWIGKSDPYCLVEEQAGKRHKTHVVTSTQAPRWGRLFELESSVYDTLTVRVIDMHASPEMADLGSVSFKPIDMLKRVHADNVAREHGAGHSSGLHVRSMTERDEDTDWMQWVELNFSLQTLNGLPSTGSISITMHVDGHVDLNAESKDKHIELLTMADNLLQGHSLLGILNEADTAAVTKIDILSILGGERPLLPGVNSGFYARRSLMVLGPTSTIRKRAYKIVNSWLFAFLSWTAASAALLSFVVNQKRPTIDINDPLAMVEFASFCWLGLEMLLKSIAFGFWQGARSFWFSSFFNITDLLVFASYWAEMAIWGMPSMHQFTLRPLRSFRILVPLMQFTVFGGLTAIFTSLKLSFVSMSTIVLFLLIFAVGFAVFGITFYANSFARRCVSVATGALIVPHRWCKISKDGSSQSCPEPLMTCKVVGNDGPNHFDTLDGALTAVFQALSLDEQWDSLNRALQSEPEWSGLGLIFFVFLTFFCRFMLFNICVAIITQLFTKVRNEVDGALEFMAETAWSKTAYSRHRRMKKVLREAAKAVVEDAREDTLEQAYQTSMQTSKPTSPTASQRNKRASIAVLDALDAAEAGSPIHSEPVSLSGKRSSRRSIALSPRGKVKFNKSAKKGTQSPGTLASFDSAGHLSKPESDMDILRFAFQEGSAERLNASGEINRSWENSESPHITSQHYHSNLAMSMDREDAPDATKISLHEVFYMTVNHPCFEVFSMFLVIINTIMLSLDSFFASTEVQDGLAVGLLIIHTLFILELGLRMVGADSVSTFFESGSRRFDFLVILVTALALFGNFILGISRKELAPIASLSSLRFMRVMAKIPTIRHLLHMTLASITNIINLLIFTVVFLSVFAICAVYIFCPDNNETCVEYGDFHTFWASMRTLYFVFTGELVNPVMYRTRELGKVAPEYYSEEYTSNITPLFIVGFFFFSQGVVINLYIAVIIENFNVDNAKATADEQGENKEEMPDDLRSMAATFESVLPNPLRASFHRLAEMVFGTPVRAASRSNSEQMLVDAHETPPEELMKMDGAQIRELERAAADTRGAGNSPAARSPVARTPTSIGGLARQLTANRGLNSPSLSKQASGHSVLQVRQGTIMPPLFDDDLASENSESFENKAFFIFSYDSFIRQICIASAESAWFTLIILGTIFLSCVALAMEPPTRQHEPTGLDFQTLDTLNIVTTVLFTFEFVVQAVSKGLVLHPGAYLRNAWNLVDFLVLVLSYVDMSGIGETKQARVLRLGRALRPLRLIKRNQGMRLIVDALLATWRPVSMIILLAASVAIVFACIGMACFKGTFDYCSDPEGAVFPAGQTECSGTYMGKTQLNFDLLGTPPETIQWLAPRAWLKPAANFDSFSTSLVTLAAVNCFNYAHVMASASDSTSPGQSAVRDNNSVISGVFFVCYTITASLFVMNLFVAFLIDGFNQLRQAEQGERECRAVYVQYFNTVQRVSPHTAMPLPKSKFRTWLRLKVYGSPLFSSFFTFCVFINVSIMALYSEELYPELATSFDIQNHFFFGLMLLEAFLSVLALGLGAYLEDRWVWVDVAAIAGSTLGYFVPESTFVRAFRLTRVFRVISNIPSLRRMLETLTASFVQIGNVVLLMLVVFSMFAILCVNFLGTVREGIPVILGGRLGSPIYEWPANPPNFSSFSKSMVVLFQIVQGDDWHLLMYDSMVQEPFCTEQFEGRSYGDCGTNSFAAVVIFVGFKLVAEFVLLNLFIGMILDAFMKTSESRIEFYLATAPVVTVKGARKGSKKGSNSKSISRSSVASSKMTSTVVPEDDKDKDIQGTLGLGSESAALRRKLANEMSCVEAWKKVVGEGRNDFMLISDATVLTRSLPQPLGFARNAFGEPIMTSHDRAALKLIRAELNLIAVSRPEDEQGFFARLWLRFRSWLLGLEQNEVPDSAHATFDEVFETLFHWRCTEYIPNEVREERSVNIAEVVRTAHAILVARLIRRWIYVSRAKKAPGYQAGAKSLIHWMAENNAGQATDAAVINAALGRASMTATPSSAYSHRRGSATQPGTPAQAGNVFQIMDTRLGSDSHRSDKSDARNGSLDATSRVSSSPITKTPGSSPIALARTGAPPPSPGFSGLHFSAESSHSRSNSKTNDSGSKSSTMDGPLAGVFGDHSENYSSLSKFKRGSGDFSKHPNTRLRSASGDHGKSPTLFPKSPNTPVKDGSDHFGNGSGEYKAAGAGSPAPPKGKSKPFAPVYKIPPHESVRNHVPSRGVYRSTFEAPKQRDTEKPKGNWGYLKTSFKVGQALKSASESQRDLKISGGAVEPIPE